MRFPRRLYLHESIVAEFQGVQTLHSRCLTSSFCLPHVPALSVFILLVDYWRERDTAKTQYKKQKHDREETLDADSRAMKFLPRKDAPDGRDHRVALAKRE